MSVHSPHPTIQIHGLADGCERCGEMAADPWTELDDGNLARLVERTIACMHDDGSPRSDNEWRAMRQIAPTLVRMRQINRLGIEVPE